MPSGQILYLMMFVGNLACTSHVLQYSSSRSYEHSRSLQSILCPGVVTVLICSFFVVALLFVYINLENGGKIIQTAAKLYIFSQTAKLFRIFFAFSVNFTQERIGYFAEFLYFCTRKHQEQSSSDGHANRAKRSHGGQYDAGEL